MKQGKDPWYERSRYELTLAFVGAFVVLATIGFLTR